MDRRSALIAGIAVVLAGFLAFWALSPRADAPPELPEGLTEVSDPAVIATLVTVDGIGIKTSTSFVGHRVYPVHGTLKNLADKPIRMAQARMIFHDYDGKPVHEEVHQVFELKWKPLEPGTEYQFEIAFENMPRTWNHKIPDIEIVKVAY